VEFLPCFDVFAINPQCAAHHPSGRESLASGEIPSFIRLFSANPRLFKRGGTLGNSGTRVIYTIAGILALAVSPGQAAMPAEEAASQLVRETIYNELQDHNNHGYWRYWIQQRVESDTKLEEQVETADGPLKRLVQTNGQPLDAQTRDEERARLQHLVNSPQELASHRKDYLEDEKHVAVIMALLPDAFLFENVGQEAGCYHLRFRPNPRYDAHSIEQRVVHAMAGDLWIDTRMKRLSKLEGRLSDKVDFGFGLLGRLDKGGSFQVQRVQVSPTEWKTQKLELHLSGRAVLFKTIERETSEVRGGFAAVPAGLNLAQGMRLLEQTDAHATPDAVARVVPASLATRH
jgi:hypothetical protein